MSFRAFGECNERPFRAHLLVIDETAQRQELIDLSERYARYGIGNTADPKLAVLNDGVWVTFNSGYAAGGNEIFIAKVYPKMGRPYLCEYENRARIEKNWAFFHDGGLLKAVYALRPMSILVQQEQDDASYVKYFKAAFTEEGAAPLLPKSEITIGTQVVAAENGLYLIAHEKIRLGRKRMYMGVPTLLEEKDGVYSAYASRRRIVHSYWSMLGSRTKQNRNLWSCTYFSGLRLAESSALIAYGINDLDYGFKEVPLETLWGRDVVKLQ